MSISRSQTKSGNAIGWAAVERGTLNTGGGASEQKHSHAGHENESGSSDPRLSNQKVE